MPLLPGTPLGPYGILALIGSGGMGEVYRASDSRLGRAVAIKISAARFSDRFAHEARLIASLNHPNICTLHDVGPDYLVMELIEGLTLSERIKEGAISLDESLAIAKQIADALEAAHEKGIVHLDLKPGNVKIKPDGTVKVLDFGLAKTRISGMQSENSPTMTIGQSEAGMILGTAAYMSPEQAKGKPVDKRADIWAFGVVLYEMLTRERLHQGETLSETLAAVLKEQPDLNRVPPQVRPLLRSCLQKDPKDRLHDIADWKLLIEKSDSIQPTEAPVKGLRKWMWPAVAGVLLLAATALGVALFRQTPPVAEEVRLQIPVPEGLAFISGTTPAISPDGLRLAFPAKGPDGISRMYVRALNSLEVRPLPGSEGIIASSPPPFWSYDSSYVVYGAGGKLMKSDVAGAARAQEIADTGLSFVQGGSWSREDVIIYAQNSGNLMQVSGGGKPVPLTVKAPGEAAHRWPQFLPDNRRFLYLRVSNSREKTGIYVGSIDKKPEDQDMTLLLPTDHQAWWTEIGGESFLIFQRENTLMARPFDTTSLHFRGDPFPIAAGAGSYPEATAGLWSVARNGALAYRSGGAGLPQLTWVDLNGRPVGVVGEPDTYAPNFAMSPDGRRVAFALTDAQGNQDVWVRDVEGGKKIQLTHDPRRDDSPAWSHDGTKIIFAADRGGNMDLYEKNADGSGEEKLLFKSDQDKVPTGCSHDGRFLLFQSSEPKTSQDLWFLSLTGDPKASVFLKTQDNETFGQFSPDDRWIAYTSTKGSSQIHVRPFSPESGFASDGTGPQWKVSEGDGTFPRWSSDGKHLYYVSLSNRFMAADVHLKSTFSSDNLRQLFKFETIRPWDAARGDRFLFRMTVEPTGPPPPFTVVLDWVAGLKK